MTLTFTIQFHYTLNSEAFNFPLGILYRVKLSSLHVCIVFLQKTLVSGGVASEWGHLNWSLL